MSGGRLQLVENALTDVVRKFPALNGLNSLSLDVGTGHGEAMDMLRRMGWSAQGCDIVRNRDDVDVAPAWDLPYPDDMFGLVTMFDVIEHLLPGDDLPGDDFLACRELRRVSAPDSTIIINASNRDSIWKGIQLHVNKRPYEEWDALFRDWFAGDVVEWYQQHYKGHMWVIRRGEDAS